MSWSGHRAATSKKFEMSEDINTVIKFAKKYHRADKEFYIVMIDGYYSDCSSFDFQTYNYKNPVAHYMFIGNRWKAV